MPGPLSNITLEVLAPIWARLDIRIADMAEALNVSRAAVSFRAKALGLPPRTHNQEPNKRATDFMFREMWEAGVSTGDMAKHFGYAGSGSISARRRLMGLKARVRSVAGEPVRGRGFWAGTISIEEFWQNKLREKMQAEASRSRAPRAGGGSC